MSNLKNRGKSASDDSLFGTKVVNHLLDLALKDMFYLLSHNYGLKSSCQLVGNRYQLNSRQQKALMGMSCCAAQKQHRKSKELQAEQVKNKVLFIDGFNLLITLESALSGAYLFKGMDGAYRDLSAVHGTYKKVNQTQKAIDLIALKLEELQIKSVHWIFDQPVSNSGRLKTLLRQYSEEKGLNWKVDLEFNPDKILAESGEIIVSSDAWILDNCSAWFNFLEVLIPNTANVVNK